MKKQIISKQLAAFATMVLIFCAINSSAFAQSLSYQGVLKTMAGNISAGTRLLTVTLYADANGNETLWQSTMNTPIDSNGVFNLMLGSADNPLPGPSAMDRPIWLGVAIDNGPELRPLSQITASAYAINVADNAITSQKISAGAVLSANLADSAVTTTKLADNAITSQKIAAGTVEPANLADGAVTSTKLADSAVTSTKLNMDYVSSISVNGQKVTGQASNLNIIGGDGVNLTYDDASKSLLLNTSGSATSTDGKGADPQNPLTDWELAGNTLTGGETLGSLLGSSSGTWTVQVVGEQVGMFQYVPTGIADIVGGSVNNQIYETTDGSEHGGNFIGGGGDNTGAGGDGNIIYYSHFATIGGGLGNRINYEDRVDSTNVYKFQVVGGGEKNHALRKYSALLGGYFNKAWAEGSSIGAGYSNVVDSEATWSTIAGGDSNRIEDTTTFIGGGYRNTTIAGNMSAIAGGEWNSISNGNGAIGGGRYNLIYGAYGTIAGGDTNSINVGESHSNYDAVGGGLMNNITESDSATIAGGAHNIVGSAPSGFIGGGTYNTIYTSRGSTIGGGDTNFIGTNIANTDFSFIGGGMKNYIVEGQKAVIAGGDSNIIEGDYSSTGGGFHNRIEAVYSHIGGGDTNYIYNFNYSVIGGGEQNNIVVPSETILDHSFIGGGYQNTIQSGFSVIGGGNTNEIYSSSDRSFIGSGRLNQINGLSSVIAGGDTNSMFSNRGVIGGGDHNQSYQDGSMIGGGSTNYIGYATYGYSTISGGTLNHVEEDYNGIGAGAGNIIFDPYETYDWYNYIGGGYYDTIRSAFNAVIGGGQDNVVDILSNRGTIGGGGWNHVKSPDATIAGGNNNNILYGADYSIIGGGLTNIIKVGNYNSIVGGNSNTLDSGSSYSFIGGGRANIIGGPFSVIGGGDSNMILDIFADHNVIGGGLDNVEVDPSFGAIGGGWGNFLGWDAWGSAIAGGVFDTITTQIGFIGGGRDNHVDNFGDFGSGIGTGQSNYTNANLGFIGGGENDTLLGDISAIGGGRNNKITTGGLTAVIPGGDSLIANSYAQTVVGYNNIETGTITIGTPHALIDTALFIVGNGNNSSLAGRSNAFEVSYDGHSTVHQTNADAIANSPIEGATYTDNIIYAWGDVTSPGAVRPSLIGSSSTTQSFGATVSHTPLTGIYTIKFAIRNASGTVLTLDGAAMTVTLVDDGLATDCAIPLVKPLASGGTGFSGQIEVDVRDLGSGTCSVLADHEFMFQLAGRVH